MECLFAGFDYAVIDQSGASRVVARNEESAFLTKHLRAYGGTGEYEGYKIGRSLKDISFSGKGLVSRPANPRSVILDSSKAFSVNQQHSISNVSKGDFNMPDTNLEGQLADLQNTVASSQEDATTVKAETESVNTEFADQVSALESTIAEKELALKTYEEKLANLEATLASKEKELSEISATMHEMKKKEKSRMRKEKLVMAGFEDAEAEESINLYDALSDEAFEAVIAAMKKKLGEMKYKMDKEEKKEMASETTVATEVKEEITEELFQEVNSTEATLVDASEVNDALEATRASVAEWLTENVLRK
jgi:septal ring factor EnvC (AmiA/AmiB activator)